MENIIETFIDLVKIPSPSGDESRVRNYIIEKLVEAGWKTVVDKAGNLISYKNAQAKLWLVAHMDTVQLPGQFVKPVIMEKVITSDGTTILGADNKVGVAILLDLADSGVVIDDCGLVFTVNEESGEMGSSKIGWGDLQPKLILNIDGSNMVGNVNDCGMGQIVFEAEIWGQSAHAAKNPEYGVNAIMVASNIISNMKLGKDSMSNTCNVGRIEGGGATNVVPDYVKFWGEVRSLNTKSLELKWQMLNRLVDDICKKYKAKYTLVNKEEIGVPVWEKGESSQYIHILKSAAKAVGIKFYKETMYASSDANYLSKIAETYCINHGGSKAHSKEEWIEIEEILMAKKYIESIVLTFNKLTKI